MYMAFSAIPDFHNGKHILQRICLQFGHSLKYTIFFLPIAEMIVRQTRLHESLEVASC